jgi:predicted transcriptional regulator
MRPTFPMRSADRATLVDVTPAPPPLSLRLGKAGMRALEELARARGVSKAEAARQAIAEAAERETRRGQLAAEARRLSEDPAYVAEARELVDLMEALDDSG